MMGGDFDADFISQASAIKKDWNKFAVNHRAHNFKKYREKQKMIVDGLNAEEEVNQGQDSQQENSDDGQEIKGITNSSKNKEEGFNRFRAFGFGIEKAGMDPMNTKQIEKILKSTISNQQFYITQEQKMNETENKIANYKKKIAQYRNSEQLWKKTCADVKLRLDVYKKERVLTHTWLQLVKLEIDLISRTNLLQWVIIL